MSLVQAVLCSDFALVCGEQQLNLNSGGVLHNFRKIFKLNEYVIIGLSGVIEDNYYLFQDYLNVDFTEGGCQDRSCRGLSDRVRAVQDGIKASAMCSAWSRLERLSAFEGKPFTSPPSSGRLNRSLCKQAHEADAKLISCGRHNRHLDNLYGRRDRHGADI